MPAGTTMPAISTVPGVLSIRLDVLVIDCSTPFVQSSVVTNKTKAGAWQEGCRYLALYQSRGRFQAPGPEMCLAFMPDKAGLVF